MVSLIKLLFFGLLGSVVDFGWRLDFGVDCLFSVCVLLLLLVLWLVRCLGFASIIYCIIDCWALTVLLIVLCMSL